MAAEAQLSRGRGGARPPGFIKKVYIYRFFRSGDFRPPVEIFKLRHWIAAVGDRG
ncbi:hypothetical protein HanHA300_Chr16g0615051 [Helianthus annuus]|nr:hypothetical protein HanHA300_Chr16g0615051 [Helianthus annuus]KAJ0641290.1 hypothetical protein HanLR1_Chr16g0625551 [Helianthus annuus]